MRVLVSILSFFISIPFVKALVLSVMGSTVDDGASRFLHLDDSKNSTSVDIIVAHKDMHVSHYSHGSHGSHGSSSK